VDNRVLDFGHRGWLYEESFLFYDYQTDSLWAQATGETIYGPYKGVRLNRLASTQSTWHTWRSLHPETRVLGRHNTSDYWIDSYATYYLTGKGIKYDRHGPLTFGLAVTLDSAHRIYPFPELEKQPLVLDSVGGKRVVVVYHAASKTAAAFIAEIDGKALDFALVERGDVDVTIRDRQTGSTWSGLMGRCTQGPARGTRLRQADSSQFIVENWKLHYPSGSVYHPK
jgi:hypothetical protein